MTVHLYLQILRLTILHIPILLQVLPTRRLPLTAQRPIATPPTIGTTRHGMMRVKIVEQTITYIVKVALEMVTVKVIHATTLRLMTPLGTDGDIPDTGTLHDYWHFLIQRLY